MLSTSKMSGIDIANNSSVSNISNVKINNVETCIDVLGSFYAYFQTILHGFCRVFFLLLQDDCKVMLSVMRYFSMCD